MRFASVPLLLLACVRLSAADLAAANEVAADSAAVEGVVKLSLKRAVGIALSNEGNPKIQIAYEDVLQASARSAEARAALLPDIEGQALEQNLVRSLGALGVDALKLAIPIHLPTEVGPFNVTDIRATATQSLFDFSSITRWRAAKTQVKASKADRENANDVVSSMVAKAYAVALRGDADAEAAKSDVELAQGVLRQSQSQKAAGEATGIDVTQAEVQLADDEQRLLGAQSEQRKAYLQLLRTIGMPLDTTIELTDKFEYVPTEPITVNQATEEALKNRADLRAQLELEQSSKQSAEAVKMERLPSVAAFANYGTTGQTDFAVMPSRLYGAELKVPVFDGGRRDARRAETASQYREQHVRSSDMRQQIELDVRLALDSLHTAEAQMRVAEGGLTLANSQLEQARRRYSAGVSNNLEVTDAQTRLAHARNNQISALLNYHLARIDLNQAMGTIRQMIQ
jgi:outer membrane protein